MQPNSMQPTAAPSVPVTPMAAPKQKNMGLIAGMVISVLLGIGGISFGVFSMISAQQKTPEIADLDIKYTTKEGETVKIDTDKIEVSEDKKTIKIDESTIKKTNPIITTSNYSIGFSTDFYDSKPWLHKLNLSINNGAISSCSVYSENVIALEDCKINGITGRIYKVARIGEGQDGIDDSLAFILEDGTVDYMPVNEIFATSSEETIKGKVKINGFVTDIMTINVVDENGYGYGSTVFVLSDGSIVKYNKDTMLQ